MKIQNSFPMPGNIEFAILRDFMTELKNEEKTHSPR